MKEQLVKTLGESASKLGISSGSISLEYPDQADHGDFSSNLALANSKTLKTSPQALAAKIVEEFNKVKPDFVESVSIAGPGFINFKIKDAVLAKEAIKLPNKPAKKNNKVMVEYTDPNPFKVFHIGHLMSNAIGESISRLIEHSGNEVIRACYQGDVGLHVAKTIWALIHEDEASIKMNRLRLVTEKVKLLGEMYAIGSSHENEPTIQKEIADVNKKIFEKTDPKINKIYEEGRKLSLEYFDTIYARLGTHFNKFFFESEVADDGVKVVGEFLKKGVFEESDGAIVFKGENHGLHTRVFITSQGLPTYETKELGLNKKKFSLYPDLNESIIITANEQNEYFKVLLKAFDLIDKPIASKTKHLSHGIMRFAEGKMSSRTGNVISAESLIDEIKGMVRGKMGEIEFTDEEVEETSDQVAIGAIKYTILRQAIGGDVIFDSASSISFEGDSGPYLQYSAVRANSVLKKASWFQRHSLFVAPKMPEKVGLLERLIIRFPDIVERARNEYAPQHVANYLIQLSGAFNSFYAHSMIVDSKEPLSKYRIALTRSFLATMTEGLWLLGIKVPKKM